jgi:HEAT repeat protein
MPISEKMNLSDRMIYIRPTLLLLLEDCQEDVRNIAIKSLGIFVSHLGKRCSPDLINKYVCFITSSDTEIARAVAAAFTSVAVALGKANWPVIQRVFQAGLSSPDFEVRRSLAFGLGSFGSMIDSETLTICALDLANDVSDVAVGVLANLKVLLPTLDDPTPFLALFKSPRQTYPKWRTRLEVSRQLRICSQYFPREALLPAARDLLLDEVPRVREDAIQSYVELMSLDDLDVVTQFAQDKHWVKRFMAASLFGKLKPEAVKKLLDVFERLVKDRVPNVRVAAARSYENVAAGISEEVERLEELKKILLEDRDEDVRGAVAAK